MDDDASATPHDPGARLGGAWLGGPDGRERLAPAHGEPAPATPAGPTAPPAQRPPPPATGRGRRRLGRRSALAATAVVAASALAVAVAAGTGDDGPDTELGGSDGSRPATTTTEVAGTAGDPTGPAGMAGDPTGPTGTATEPSAPGQVAPAQGPMAPAEGAAPGRRPVVGGCARPDLGGDGALRYLEAGCESPLATVRLTEALPVPAGAGAHCPIGTDVVLVVTEEWLGPEAPAGLVPEAWCLRNLQAPHPGDPGRGGGELLVGDCAGRREDGMSVEAACDGSGPVPARYAVTAVPGPDGTCPDHAPTGLVVEEPFSAEYCLTDR